MVLVVILIFKPAAVRNRVVTEETGTFLIGHDYASLIVETVSYMRTEVPRGLSSTVETMEARPVYIAVKHQQLQIMKKKTMSTSDSIIMEVCTIMIL